MSDLSAPGHAAVRVVHVANPAADAPRLAEELGADVASDVGVAEQLVRARVEAGRRAVGSDGDDDVLASADAIRAAAATPPPISDGDVEELRHLAADIGRAGRIRERTETKVAEALQARVAASTGMAIHPEAVLAAAKAVLDAEASLAAAEQALDALGPRPAVGGDPGGAPVEADGEDDPVLRQPHDDFDEAALVRRRAVARAFGLGCVVAGLGILAFAVGAPAVVLAAAGLLAAVVVVLVVVRGRAEGDRIAERDESSLAVVTRTVESTHSGRLAAAMDARDSWVEDRSSLDAARDEAEELLRLARSRWHQLAGPQADPHDADAVVRGHDPQLAYDEKVAASSPTVRTVAAFHRRTLARWRVLWAGLGREEPPAPEALEAELDRVLADHRAAQAALAALEAAEARAAAATEARRPIILVEPRGWVAPGRLAQLLSSVPPEGEIVLLERDPGNRAS